LRKGHAIRQADGRLGVSNGIVGKAAIVEKASRLSVIAEPWISRGLVVGGGGALAPGTRATGVLEVEDAHSIADLELALVGGACGGDDAGDLVRGDESYG